MKDNIKYEEINGISKLFIDFINDNPQILKRFPNNGILNQEHILNQRASEFRNRDILFNAFQNSMSYIDLLPKQKENLASIVENGSLAIVSGQQVGFLGGQMYSIYKIMSSIRKAEELSTKYPNLKFVPVFWIEDNDHDVIEASEISILNSKGEIADFNCSDDTDQSLRTIVSEKFFNENINSEIEKVIENMPNTQHHEHINDILRDIYKNGRLWRESFIKLLQRWVGEYGVLFICASCLRKSGLFKDLIIKELDNAGVTQRLTLAANHELDLYGYHIQANASPVNLFFHEGNERFRIDISVNDDFLIGSRKYSKSELIDIAQSKPELFSPKVLLRPIFQDALIPTAAYVSGPGETGYYAQTKEMFDFFNVPMPAIIPRHSFTMFDKRTSRLFEKSKIEPTYFLREKQLIINEIANNLLDKKLESVFDESKANLQEIFDKLKMTLQELESGLVQSADAAYTKNLQQIEVLMKKTTASLKRSKEESLNKYENTSNLIFPKNKLQERIYSPLSFMIQTGEKELINIIKNATKRDPKLHHFIEIF